MLLLASVATAGACGAAVRHASAQEQHSPFLTRTVTASIQIRSPLSDCGLPALVLRLSRTLDFPAGVENVPHPCESGESKVDGYIPVTGWAVKDVLDRLQALDPRYVWRELNGVLVVRPTTAWLNMDHFLERRVDEFKLVDSNIAETLGALRLVLGDRATRGIAALGNRSEQGRRLVSLELYGATGLEMLNDVVRSHRSMQWQIEYCESGLSAQHAQVWLTTSDGIRIGATHRTASIKCQLQ